MAESDTAESDTAETDTAETDTAVIELIAESIVREQSAGIVVQDTTGRIRDFNVAATRLLQMPADVLSGRSSADPEWEAVDGQGRPLPGDRHPAMVALRTGTPVSGAVMGIRVGGGEFRWLSVDIQLHEARGEVLSVAQFVDITAERAAAQRTDDALQRLQQHALPVVEPTADWIEIQTRYATVTPPLDIGGDFLDFFDVEEDRCGFFIGDVSGHDLDAVATMVLARHTLRAAGLHLQRPGRILSWLHDTLVSAGDTVFCTAIYGDVAATEGGALRVRLANGGHPPPIRIDADGRPELVEEHGSLLGILDPFTAPPTVELTLEPGEQLVLYTDGLTESRRPRLDPFDLVDLVDRRRPTHLTATMREIDGLMATAQAQELAAQDDMAVLAIGVPRRP